MPRLAATRPNDRPSVVRQTTARPQPRSCSAAEAVARPATGSPPGRAASIPNVKSAVAPQATNEELVTRAGRRGRKKTAAVSSSSDAPSPVGRCVCRQLARVARAKNVHVTASNAPNRKAGHDSTLRAAAPSFGTVSEDAALEYSIESSAATGNGIAV